MSKIVCLPSRSGGAPWISSIASKARAVAFASAAIVVAVPLLSGCGDPADAQGGPPRAPPVSVAPAVQRTITESEEFSGRLEATEYVELRPRVAGIIDKVHFVDGAFVKKGEPMFTIDPRPFEAEVARAQSTLASNKAKLELAQSELVRAQKLLDSQAVSKPGGRPVDLRLAHLAGRRARRRGGAARRPAQSRVHVGARADLRAHVARQHHRRQSRQRAIGADHDRRREPGLRLLRRQRADLSALQGDALGRQGGDRAHGPRQRAGLPARRPARLRRQPPQRADRRDPPARQLRQRQGPVHSRPGGAAAHGRPDALPGRARCRPRDRHRPDEEVRLRRRRRRPGAVPRGQARLAARRHERRARQREGGRERRRRRPAADHSRRPGRAAGAEGRRQGDADLPAAGRPARARRRRAERARTWTSRASSSTGRASRA